MFPLKDITMVGTVLRYSTQTSEFFLINEMDHAVERLEQVAVGCNDTLRPTHPCRSLRCGPALPKFNLTIGHNLITI